MNSDKKSMDKDKLVKQSSDAIETPEPPQHMDPSVNPEADKKKNSKTRRAESKGS